MSTERRDIVERLRSPYRGDARLALNFLLDLCDEAAADIDRLRAAAQQARTALSSLIASGDRVVFSDALRALDEALGDSALQALNDQAQELGLYSGEKP